MTAGALDGWAKAPFDAAGFTRDVYRRGRGPGVVVIHEIPGITPKVIEFANEVVGLGCTVVMPDLTGTPGRAPSALYTLGAALKMCVAREFTTWALDRTSPIVVWLRALAADLHAEVGGPGVGAVGMCFSGGFVLGMMVEESVIAPVASQPSLPLARGTGRGARNLGLSPADEQAMIERAGNGCQVLALRFGDDRLVGDRFSEMSEKLGPSFIAVELPSAAKSDHSVLTEQRDDAAVATVLRFLAERLELPTA